MGILVNASVERAMQTKKCDLTAKFCMLEAENEGSIEGKLLKLNTALAYTENFSEDLIIDIYKKRINIYASLGMYQQCCENEEWIQNMLQESYVPMYVKKSVSDDNIIKKFEEQCEMDITNSVAVTKTNKLYAKKPIKSGKLIARESPFCSVLLENSIYRRCRNCLKCNNMNLIPCLKCHLAMFCSTECLNDAQFHHKFECQTSQIVAKIPFHFGGIQVAFRSLFELLDKFESSVDRMITFVNYYKTHAKKLNHLDHLGSPILEKHATMLSLRHFSTDDCYSELVTTIKHVLQMYNFLDDLFVTDVQKAFLLDFLVMQSSLDLIVHFDYKLDAPTALSVNFVYNLMEHSCNSNVHAIFDDGMLYYFTKYPIEKKEALTYNHLLSFESSNLEIRKLTAKKCQFENCTCTACEENYPIFYSLNVNDHAALEDALSQQEDISKMKRKDLKNALKENCQYIDQNYSANFPSQELCVLNSNNSIILSKLLTKDC